VKVIAPLPVIELYCEEQKFSELNQNKIQDSSNDKSDNIDEKHDGETEGSGEGGDGWGRVENLVLFSGEERTLRLVINNNGPVPAHFSTITCVSEDLDGPEVDLDPRLTLPPLSPGDSCTVPIKIRGIIPHNYRAEDGLSTAGSDSRWSASGFNSLQSRLSHPNSLPSHTNLPSSSHHPLAGSDNPSLLSQLSESSEGRVSVLSVKVELKGEEDDWCRISQLQLSVCQIPSISISRWDILAGDRVDNCFLVLDLVNRTAEEMELTYAGRKQLQIEAADTCRVPLPVEKCSFSESLDWREGCPALAEYMDERVQLDWSIGEGPARRAGSASLAGVSWTEMMLEMLRRPPLTGTVVINGQMAEEGRPLEVSVGSVMEVEVGLENSLLEPVEDCRVLVRLEQDNTGVAGVGSAGSSGLHLPGSLPPGDSCSHACSLLPLSPGQYSLLVSVSLLFRGKIHSWRLPNLTINVPL